jgi:EmrB/QacA subfamily drug resistance transporter
MSILDSSIVNVAISSIMTVFNTDTAGVEWVSTAYMLAMGMVVPLSGWLGDKIGLKRLYLWCLVAFTAGSVLCAAAWSIESLIAARVLQALGGGMLMPTVMAIIYRLVPREQMGTGMGIFGMAIIVAPAVGPTLGGYLVEYVDWRWIFTINLPVGILGGILGLFLIPEFSKHREAGKFDLPGAITAAAGFAGLLYVLSKGNDWGWTDERTILTLVGSLGMLLIFVLIELWSPAPLLDLKVFSFPSFTFANIAVIITTIGMFAGLFYIPLFLQSIRGLGAMETGMLMFPSALASGVIMPISGILYDRFGPRVLMVGGLVLMATTTWLISGISLDTGLGTITWWLIWRGVSMGLCMMPAQTAAMNDMPNQLVSRATSVTSIIRNVASSFGIAIMTVLVSQRNTFHTARMSDSLGPDNTAYSSWLTAHSGVGPLMFSAQMGKQSFVYAIQDIFLLTAVFTLLAIVPALFLKKKQKPNTAGAPAAVME